MRALFFGTYDTRTHPRVGVLIEGLRHHGIAVSECNAPLGLSTAARVQLLRRPWRLPLLAFRLAGRWSRLVRCARRHDPPDVVVVGYLGHFDVRLARRLFRNTTLALDHLVGASDTATDRGIDVGLRQRLLRRLDSGALAATDIVIVDTEEHRSALPESERPKSIVVAVGAAPAWFIGGDGDEVDEPSPTGRLRVVFFGLYTPLHGAPVIGAALAQLADDAESEIDVMMIGTGQDLAATRKLARVNPRVTWRDWVTPTDLPTLVAAHDVCLGIFGTSPKALRVVPNKVFQGAAAGCAILTSDTPPQRRSLGDAGVFVPPGNATALAAALRELARDRGALQQARSAAAAVARQNFTAAAVAAPLAEQLDALR